MNPHDSRTRNSYIKAPHDPSWIQTALPYLSVRIFVLFSPIALDHSLSQNCWNLVYLELRQITNLNRWTSCLPMTVGPSTSMPLVAMSVRNGSVPVADTNAKAVGPNRGLNSLPVRSATKYKPTPRDSDSGRHWQLSCSSCREWFFFSFFPNCILFLLLPVPLFSLWFLPVFFSPLWTCSVQSSVLCDFYPIHKSESSFKSLQFLVF